MAEERPRSDEEGARRWVPSSDGGLLRATPALAQLTAVVWWRSAKWVTETWIRAGSRMARAAASGESPGELWREAQNEARDQARRLLGIEGEETPIATAVKERISPAGDDDDADQSLRQRGAELLRRSADVHFAEEAHPAYTRILEELSPDEGRILRLLALQGPQPSVDVRSGLIPLQISSELVGTGLNMIGAEAGCRHLDDVPAYLNNLFRLGLIWFSRESLSDPLCYQVLEAQPEVVNALEEAGRARTVRRSIHLTPFGEDFCEKCLPLDEMPGRRDGDGEAAPKSEPAPDADGVS